MLPWIAVSAVLLAIIAVLSWRLRPRKPAPPAALPTEWAIAARPVFGTGERRVYRLLREALPHHIILAKLPLVRFCQPIDPGDVGYWYQLLGSSHVGFAVCSANGRVLAAIDLDDERGPSRNLQIKQSVLDACRVRYLRCPIDSLPSIAELQLLVPQNNAPPRGPQPGPAPLHDFHDARSFLSTTLPAQRTERVALWVDSTPFHDSLFSPENRLDASGLGTPGASNDGSTDANDAAWEADGRGMRPRQPHPHPSPTRH